ncbi:hypothetical protein [Sphingomonas desiccabilis]|uniref:Uncharacterized protein n=1 Tax=Sphingomonas desiccabilis TaxID=429134 RepID=A0A4Q2IV78_9SPHN|nr:hypothetical protein [Sphingomonas desiccabilis]MBB3909765.1 hypothetical protein [Sphingomonas desiccabilis]RXZ34455.1 hypothetical protein EO081_01825 [Sphingomonas desiccabilis]
MPNYVVAIEAAGSRLSLDEIEEHISKKPNWCSHHLLGMVWMIGTFDADWMVWDHLSKMIGPADRLFLTEGSGGYSTNLAVNTNDRIKQTWKQYEEFPGHSNAARGADFTRAPPLLKALTSRGL